MKKILLLLTLLPLSGCVLVNSYLMPKFDPNEYQLITNIRVEAQVYKTKCDDFTEAKKNAVKLSYDVHLFALYSEHIPRNEKLIAVSNNLDIVAQELADRYNTATKVSITFCKIKFQSVELSADKIQAVVGGRPR